jgi:hypothetical protein
MDKAQNESTREPYEAPVVEDIPLHPEEVMLAGCKVAIGPSPSSGGAPCALGACVGAGVS